LAGNLKIESMDLLPELEVEEDEEEEGEEAPAASMHADDSAGHDEF
jgi:hypothetical protein